MAIDGNGFGNSQLIGAYCPYFKLIKMKSIIILITILISNQLFPQKTKFQVLNIEDRKPIENIHIYADSILIDKTNKDGIFNIDLKKIKKIALIKEDYYDSILNTNTIFEKIYLKKINSIILKEVIVANLGVDNILDSIHYRIKSLKNISITQNLHFFNSLTSDNDTLAYINKRLTYKNRDGYYCENDNFIVKNFKLTAEKRPVYLNKKGEIYFNYNYLHFSEPYSSRELQVVTKFKNEFNYSIIKSDGYYKISFNHKNKNKDFPYTGYFIIDIDDYGIYEFRCITTIDDKNKRNVVFNSNIINYRILNEECFIKYHKNENGKYELVTYNFDSELLTLDGFFKNSKIKNKCRKESTYPFEITDTKKIDLSTYQLIK